MILGMPGQHAQSRKVCIINLLRPLLQCSTCSLVLGNTQDFLEYHKVIDSSASKPALRQNTGYMVEKTYNDI